MKNYMKTMMESYLAKNLVVIRHIAKENSATEVLRRNS